MGEEFKAPRYTSTAATHNYIITRDIIPNNNYIIIFKYYTFISLYISVIFIALLGDTS